MNYIAPPRPILPDTRLWSLWLLSNLPFQVRRDVARDPLFGCRSRTSGNPDFSVVLFSMVYKVILLAEKSRVIFDAEVAHQFPKLKMRFTDEKTIPAGFRIKGTTVTLQIEHRGVQLKESKPFKASVVSADRELVEFEMLDDVDLPSVA